MLWGGVRSGNEENVLEQNFKEGADGSLLVFPFYVYFLLQIYWKTLRESVGIKTSFNGLGGLLFFPLKFPSRGSGLSFLQESRYTADISAFHGGIVGHLI